MKIGGRAHNHALYVPELVPNVKVAAVPLADQAGIYAAIAGDWVATREARATLAYASADDVDSAWPGTPYAATLNRGRVAIAATPASMRTGVQETIDAYVTNESEETWRWGKEARPEIRLGYQWSLDGVPVHEPTTLRTSLPADLRPGATQLVPVHVVPPLRVGTYTLQLHLLHEGVGCFGSASPVELEVRERELLAVVGLPTSVTQTLAHLAPSPEVEPVVVLGNDSDRPAYGDRRSVSGLREALLVGLERSGRLSRSFRLTWRSLSIVWSARRYRRTGISHDLRLADLFDLLSHSQALVIAGTDWPDDAAPGREWLRLVTTVLAARALDLPVFVSNEAVPRGTEARNVVFRWLIVRSSSPIAERQPPLRPPVLLDPEVVGAEAVEDLVVASI